MSDYIPGVSNFFRRKGELAYLAGRSRDSHEINHKSVKAIAFFHEGYDAAHEANDTPASSAGIDLAQEHS